jgi:hypothetical protein
MCQAQSEAVVRLDYLREIIKKIRVVSVQGRN